MFALHLTLIAFTLATALASSPQDSSFSFHFQDPNAHSIVAPLSYQPNKMHPSAADQEKSARDLNRAARDAWNNVSLIPGIDRSKSQFASQAMKTHDDAGHKRDSNLHYHQYFSHSAHTTHRPWTDSQIKNSINEASKSAEAAQESLNKANAMIKKQQAARTMHGSLAQAQRENIRLSQNAVATWEQVKSLDPSNQKAPDEIAKYTIATNLLRPAAILHREVSESQDPTWGTGRLTHAHKEAADQQAEILASISQAKNKLNGR